MGALRRQPTAQSIEARLNELCAQQHGLFTRRQALDLGATDAYLRHGLTRGRYRSPYRGVYASTAARSTWLQSLLAAIFATGGKAYASHRAAAALLALAGFERAPVEISTLANTRRRLEAIVHHVEELPACDLTRLHGVPATNATRTLLDLAAVAGPAALEIALDDALRRGLTSVARLRWRHEQLRAGRRRGFARIGRILAERDPLSAPAESPLETRMAQALREHGLPEPQAQFVVACEDGTIARLDFAYPEHMVAIEVEGYAHHSGRARWERDLSRRNSLEASGWRVLHVTARQLAADGSRVCERIERLLRR